MIPAFPLHAVPPSPPASPFLSPRLPKHDAPNDKHVIRRLYLSHFLSTWNSRTFEFGAVLFLAQTFAGTLTYASIYALVRSLSAVTLSTWVGHRVDQADRLVAIRHSIVWQRIPVAVSCALFAVLSYTKDSAVITVLLFIAIVLLACPEKLAAVANMVAVERDWVVVISRDDEALRRDLNAVMRRIDLFCKLVAPLIISAVDAYSSLVAVWVVLAQNVLSAAVEYYAIAQVYRSVPDLKRDDMEMKPMLPDEESAETARAPTSAPSSKAGMAEKAHGWLRQVMLPMKEYVGSSVFLPSISLSITYCTVLALGVPMVAYLFATGMPAYQVSLLRVVSVAAELSGTWFGPKMMEKIGPDRAGLWFVNWLFGCVLVTTALFVVLGSSPEAVWVLVGGTILSRFGLWAFDLCAQFLVQEDIPQATRARFSSTEAALQNLFEMLSFVSTIVYSRPDQFQYPSMISCGAIGLSCICFTAFVRKRRGHLIHAFGWLTKRNGRYQGVPQSDIVV